jgi:site-specific recombinase XerD
MSNLAAQPAGTPPVQSFVQRNSQLADKFIQWLEVGGRSAHTIRAYGRLAHDFADFIGSRSILDCQHFDVRDYLSRLQKRGTSGSTIARQICGLRAFFGFLQMGGAIPRNIVGLIKNRKTGRKLPKCLTEAEINRLIACAGNDRDRAIIELLYASGLRAAELCSINIQDVDFDARQIRVLGK